MWHRQGKVSLTKGSDVVTGVGTAWVENIRVGDAFQGPDGKLYQVINVASNESLAISPAYEGNTATNLNYWIVPVPGYSKTQADRLSLIISKLDGDILSATDAADRAQVAAQQAQQWGNEAAASAAAALQSEQSAALSADIAEQARDDAVAVVTGGTASIDPEAGKIPIAGAQAAIKQAWIENLQFELDALRVAKNRILYGDGPYPVLDFQFAGAKYLDPRIQFTRASLDWDEYGKEYGINKPAITDDGLWASGARTNLFLQSIDLLKTPWRSLGSVRRIEGLKSPAGADVFSLDRSEQGVNYFYQPISILPGRSYVVSCFVKFETGEEEYRLFMGSTGFQDYGTAIFKQGSDGEMIVTGSGRYKSLGAGWYLIWRSAVGADVVSGNPIQIHAYPVETEIDNYISAPQLEVGLIPTPYIPTGGSQVTVAPSFQNLPRSLKGDYTVFVDFTPIAPANGYNITGVFSIFKSSTNAIAITLFGESLRLTFYGQGSGQRASRNFVYGQRYKTAITLRDDKVWFFVNGEMLLADEGLFGGIINDFDTLILGSVNSASIPTRAPTSFYSVSVFDKNLTDEQLQELTTL